MEAEIPSVSQQLEALRHDWREFPLLITAVNHTKQILEHPEDYVCQRRDFPGDIIPLREETQNGRHPLSGITYLYDISPSQQEIPTSHQKTFLQVHFRLCATIHTPRPSDFGPHISIIYASVDDKGEILPLTVEQWELEVKKSMMGRAKIVLANPQILIKDTRLNLETEINRLTDPTLATELYKTIYYAWTGTQVDISPRSLITA